MGIATITVYTETRAEAVAVEKDAAAALTKAGAVIDKVEVKYLGPGQRCQHTAKVRYHGDMSGIIEDVTLEDLACDIWNEVGDYCWLHIFIADGNEEVQEKFSRADYRELME